MQRKISKSLGGSQGLQITFGVYNGRTVTDIIGVTVVDGDADTNSGVDLGVDSI